MDAHDPRKDRDRARDSERDRDSGALACPDCRLELQDYLDGTLEKKRSLAVFLHLRDCAACRAEHESLRSVFSALDALPAVEAPADFDATVLAAVPYADYRALEPLRRERVPVYLERGFLPAWLRARATRAAGLVVAAAAGAVWLAGVGPAWLAGVAALGVAPELLVRLQGLGRRLVAAQRAGG